TGRRLFILGNSFSKPIPLNPFPFLYIPQFSRFTLLVYLTLSQVAFFQRRYRDIPRLLAGMPDDMLQRPPFAALARYWT
ncbi:hypothetical protein ACXNZO_003527, partial [Pseudomonas aeruginosa]